MERTPPKKDRSTIILLTAALLLLALVILFFQKDLIISLFHRNTEATGVKQERVTPPKIERIGDLEDPVVTEAPLETEQSVETAPITDNGPSIRTPVYFITVNDDGAIHLKSVVRTVESGENHSRQALDILLSGPDSSEINKGLFSMIPKNSRLLSIQIKDRTAWCNFNEDFQFNDLGREGYIAQLAQIVFTLTEFEEIDNVQILIEGKQLDFLGADGISIRDPLDRSHF
jgi:spore germination protein GerM